MSASFCVLLYVATAALASLLRTQDTLGRGLGTGVLLPSFGVPCGVLGSKKGPKRGSLFVLHWKCARKRGSTKRYKTVAPSAQKFLCLPA